jgi:hypothetical protein
LAQRRSVGQMAIENDDQLADAALAASSLLQEIQNYLDSKKNDLGKVQFPRGFIGTAHSYRSRLPNLENGLLARNISYAFMTLDVFRWIAVRTDLSGQALDMIIKEAICLMGQVCEAVITKEGAPSLGKRNKFTTKTRKLVELGTIKQDLKVDLDWIWDIRCREHLADVTILEWNHYTRDDHNRARRSLDQLLVSLKH